MQARPGVNPGREPLRVTPSRSAARAKPAALSGSNVSPGLRAGGFLWFRSKLLLWWLLPGPSGPGPVRFTRIDMMRRRLHTEEIKVRLTEHQRQMLAGAAGICDVPPAVLARAIIVRELEKLARAPMARSIDGLRRQT